MSQRALHKLIIELIMGTVLYDKPPGEKPGDFLKKRMRNMSEEDQNLIKNATSKDWNHRPD
jgi:hypothetical protein